LIPLASSRLSRPACGHPWEYWGRSYVPSARRGSMTRPVNVPVCVVAGIVGALFLQQDLRAGTSYRLSMIDVPGSKLTVATGIDTVGRVVGYFADGEGTHGFIWSGGAFTPISFPGAAWTAAYGVNTAGQVVGSYGPNESAGRHGFLRSGANFSSIDFPGSS